jgi:hypothetical protein
VDGSRKLGKGAGDVAATENPDKRMAMGVERREKLRK